MTQRFQMVTFGGRPATARVKRSSHRVLLRKVRGTLTRYDDYSDDWDVRLTATIARDALRSLALGANVIVEADPPWTVSLSGLGSQEAPDPARFFPVDAEVVEHTEEFDSAGRRVSTISFRRRLLVPSEATAGEASEPAETLAQPSSYSRIVPGGVERENVLGYLDVLQRRLPDLINVGRRLEIDPEYVAALEDALRLFAWFESYLRASEPPNDIPLAGSALQRALSRGWQGLNGFLKAGAYGSAIYASLLVAHGDEQPIVVQVQQAQIGIEEAVPVLKDLEPPGAALVD